MKHTWKRILPVLMILAVLCSIGWYLFIYDRDFTQDVLLKHARYFEERGKHSTATWLYNLAYNQSGDSDDIAIELAQQYIANGNYAKAEYTLSNAIADNGGSVKLYMALCQTYVEQDMLMDAVAMLDSIGDPAIRAELDSMRPAAPASSHDSGYYSQYISITLEAENGKLYASTDENYPSVQDAPVQDEISLSAGKNTIYALAVGENGLVSKLSIFNYTVAGVIEEVTLTDPAIDAAVRQQLGLTAKDTLFSSDLWAITEFEMPAEAVDYSDLQWFPYLQSLTIEGGSFSGLSVLSSLTQLNTLTILDCRDSIVSSQDISVIAALPNLQHLTLSNCQLSSSSIETLSGANNLVSLDLSNNNIRDISSLSFMAKLKELNLSHNALTNLSFISALSGLEVLDVSYNSLVSVLPLAGCPSLKDLNISQNYVETLSGTENLHALQYLYATNNSLVSVDALSGCQEIIELDISFNKLTNISSLSGLAKMTYFDFSNNQITAIPEFDDSAALVYVNGSSNRLSSVAPLSGLEQLTTVAVDHNNISTLDSLAKCHLLIRVDAFGNPISDVSKLRELSIVVNYNPA